VCYEGFLSKNRLHYHLGNIGLNRTYSRPTCLGRSSAYTFAKEQNRTRTKVYPIDYTGYNKTIIESNIDSAKDVGTRNTFRKYRYSRIGIKLTPKGQILTIYTDSGYSITLIDQNLLSIHLPNAEIRIIATPIEVRGIGVDRHTIDKYILVPLYFPRKTK